MKTGFMAAAAVFVAFSAAPAFAQQEKTPPKATKADVQKLVDSIKGDPAKMTQFCTLMKLESDSQAAAEKKDEKKLGELDKQMEEAANKLGPDFSKVTSSDMDQDSGALLDDLAKTCK